MTKQVLQEILSSKCTKLGDHAMGEDPHVVWWSWISSFEYVYVMQ